MTGQQIKVSLSILCRHQDVYYWVCAGAQVDQDVAQQKPEMVRRVSNNLNNNNYYFTGFLRDVVR